MRVGMVVALPRSFTLNRDLLYYEGEREESNSLPIAEILLIDKEAMIDVSMPIGFNEIEGSVHIVMGPNTIDKVVLTKPNAEMAYHLKLLYVQRHLNRIPVARMMVDNGAAVNILQASIMKRLGKCTDGLILTDIVLFDGNPSTQV
ncbi:hypothetical protein ACH5RR_001305 [Cinchona calisaya]|uniref:Uncharacterized protein n=1 Tax=Cinchona calisaya TaxID=153742 RepID=A0ABD3B3B6_9GENT